MTRECHVRFCERLRGQVPWPTHHFGMKAHIGVDADSGLVHTVVGTAANVNDVTQAHALLHGEETHAFGDAGYTGVTKREENQAGTVT
jgi:IS5 family transposase